MLRSDMTMTEALRQAAESRPEQEALVCGSLRSTYVCLLHQVGLLAQGLRELDLSRGDKVAALMRPSPEFVYLFFALARLNAVIVPLDPRLRPRRLRAVFRDADPVMLATGRMVAKDTLSHARGLRHVVLVNDLEWSGEHRSLRDLMMDDGETKSLDLVQDRAAPDDLLALLYTSGTTGEPKAAMHSHRSLLAPVLATLRIRELWQRPSLGMLGKQVRALARYRERLLRAAGGPQTFLSTTGWHTITGLEVMLQSLLTGDRLVVMSRFHPCEALQLVERERVTILVAVPTAYQVMLRMKDFDKRDTSSLIVCGTGAAPCPPHLAREIEDRFGCAVYIGFGATETGGAISVSSLADSDRQRTETVGRPLLETELKIVDEGGRELPPGRVGEVLCRSEGVMLGYYQAPEMTAGVLDEDGWYHTGDLAMMDEEGYLRVVGRKKDMIIRAGQNIFPVEIENYLMAHPKIREAAVVGVPAAVSGESVWAFVILEESAEMGLQEVKDYCRNALEPHEIPSQVRIVADFPRTSTGKPQKFKLRANAVRETQGRNERDADGER